MEGFYDVRVKTGILAMAILVGGLSWGSPAKAGDVFLDCLATLEQGGIDPFSREAMDFCEQLERESQPPKRKDPLESFKEELKKLEEFGKRIGKVPGGQIDIKGDCLRFRNNNGFSLCVGQRQIGLGWRF